MSNTLISIVEMARPRRALFTTFTFSLSWFEALVLPALRPSALQQIDVLVNAQASLQVHGEPPVLYTVLTASSRSTWNGPRSFTQSSPIWKAWKTLTISWWPAPI